jgi:potassium-transporting ATPase KdpC subunit
MDNAIEKIGFISQAGTSIRIAFVTAVFCCLIYPLVILGLGRTLTPYSASGSLVRNGQGEIVGSELIAQKFDRPEYFWPRPSAVDYNAAAAGGSNLSPTNPQLRERAKALVTRFKASADDPIPADLVTASGSGLDPNITLAAAKYQAERVASARGLSRETVIGLLRKFAHRPGGALTPQSRDQRVINVLLVNMALDRLDK